MHLLGLQASNILIDSNGIVKLADFGLARTWQERQDSRLTNRVITLWYRWEGCDGVWYRWAVGITVLCRDC